MDEKQYEKKDRARYETPVLKCHGNAKALIQTNVGGVAMVDNMSGLNLKT